MIHRTLGLYKGSGQAPHTVPRDAGYILPRILFNSNNFAGSAALVEAVYSNAGN